MALSLALGLLSFPSLSQAEPKPWIWSWWESHWDGLDFIPYLENGKHPHHSQWDNSSWQPQQWEAQRKDSLDVIKGFYTADIIRSQYIEDETSILEIGPGFYMLGGQDKNRIVRMVDYVYGITTSKENGMFMLHDWETGDAVGSYTRYGLQMQ